MSEIGGRKIYEVSRSRAIWAIVIGVLAGTPLSVAVYLGVLLYPYAMSEAVLKYILLHRVPSYFISFSILWGISFLFTGLVVWCVMHKVGLRGPFYAFVLGGVAPFLTVWTLIYLVGFLPPLKFALQSALVGAFVGPIVWRIAYRKVDWRAD